MGVPGLFAWLARRKYPEIVGPLPDAAPDAADGRNQSCADNLYIGAPGLYGSVTLLPIAQTLGNEFRATQSMPTGAWPGH